MKIKKKQLYSYIHIPFCDLKCKYCRFASIGLLQDKKIEVYVANLLEEIKNKNSLVRGCPKNPSNFAWIFLCIKKKGFFFGFI